MIENAAADKREASQKIEEIKSSVSLLKTGLTTKIDNFAVSYTFWHFAV